MHIQKINLREYQNQMDPEYLQQKGEHAVNFIDSFLPSAYVLLYTNTILNRPGIRISYSFIDLRIFTYILQQFKYVDLVLSEATVGSVIYQQKRVDTL